MLRFSDWVNNEIDFILEGMYGKFIHQPTPQFRRIWNSGELPESVKQIAINVYQRMVNDPMSVDLKPLHGVQNSYQIRIGDKWRAIATRNGNVFVWHWIGPRENLNSSGRNDLMNANFTLQHKSCKNCPQRPLRAF